MTIEPRSSPYQRRQINHLATDGVLAKDNVLNRLSEHYSMPAPCIVDTARGRTAPLTAALAIVEGLTEHVGSAAINAPLLL